ncbi:DUF7543 family protein [Halegenticoccus soli]|uniref:DUF7543 family protein n=1 Tax=Halegenticoccus soli TaxID=1985678 RepID=UPI000C6CA216|nr:hypothetical protein [Halegenticoccus soli]
MSWTERDVRGARAEWERSDGNATIRLRELPGGTWVVRLDRLFQAPEGALYRRETAATREEASALAAAWREAYDAEP